MKVSDEGSWCGSISHHRTETFHMKALSPLGRRDKSRLSESSLHFNLGGAQNDRERAQRDVEAINNGCSLLCWS